jgi:hypothetical protein
MARTVRLALRSGVNILSMDRLMQSTESVA